MGESLFLRRPRRITLTDAGAVSHQSVGGLRTVERSDLRHAQHVGKAHSPSMRRRPLPAIGWRGISASSSWTIPVLRCGWKPRRRSSTSARPRPMSPSASARAIGRACVRISCCVTISRQCSVRTGRQHWWRARTAGSAEAQDHRSQRSLVADLVHCGRSSGCGTGSLSAQQDGCAGFRGSGRRRRPWRGHSRPEFYQDDVAMGRLIQPSNSPAKTAPTIGSFIRSAAQCRQDPRLPGFPHQNAAEFRHAP